MTDVVLSIGSNLGDRLAHLQAAVDGLGARVRAVSPVYQTAPWGGVEQGAFLNAVVLAEDPALDAGQWLALAQQLEDEAQRRREVKWGPRTLDVDLITVLERGVPVSVGTPTLTLPHPLADRRAFVLVPWLAVQPDAVLQGRRIADLLDELGEERAGVELFEARLHGPDSEA